LMASSSTSALSSAAFSIHNEVGSLHHALSVFAEHKVNLCKIESRPSLNEADAFDFYIEFQPSEASTAALEALKQNGAKLLSLVNTNPIPWFPRTIKDLDVFRDRCLQFGAELDSDHPGFQDAAYRERRKWITDFARQHQHGQSIPRIEYLASEIETWAQVYRRLRQLYPTHACSQHWNMFQLMERECGLSDKQIPQLQDISDFLKARTGWTLRPVTGLLSSRDFLNGLAFRVFHSTQYIRHHSKPLYTPEPDVCHELLGHVPLFADPSFADFSQEIGLASLGATDEEIKKLATCYWFTIEFGLCKQDTELRAYGAGILSSFGELEYALTSEPAKKPFDPFQTALQEYPITRFQPLYFVVDSFDDAKKKLREFASSLSRPFALRYNPYTQSVAVLDTKESLLTLADDLQSEVGLLTSALRKCRF